MTSRGVTLGAIAAALVFASCGDDNTTTTAGSGGGGGGPGATTAAATTTTTASTSSGEGGDTASGGGDTTGTGAGGTGGTAPGSGGSGGAGGEGTGAGGAGGATAEGSVATLWSSTPGGIVDVQSLIVDGDTTWIAGWFSGDSLLHAVTGDSSSAVVVGSATEATTFVVGLDESGAVTASFAVARSTIDDDPSDGRIGARVVAIGDGDLVVTSSIRRGVVALGGVGDDAVPESFSRLLIARVSPDGVDTTLDAAWAALCSATWDALGEGSPTDVSVRSSGLAAVPGGGVAVAASLGIADAFDCTAIGTDGDEPCGDRAFTEAEGAVVFTLERDGGACDGTIAVVTAEGGHAAIDDLEATADGELVVSGRVTSASVVQPWGADLGDAGAYAFAAQTAFDGVPGASDVRSFAGIGGEARAAADGSFVSATPSGPLEDGTYPATDVRLELADGTELALGDPDDASRSELATDVVVDGGAVLVVGSITEGASVADHVCGAACSGDLEPDPDTCPSPTFDDVDGFWLYLTDVGQGPAVGRSLGGCGKQRVVAGALGDELITLAIAVEGSATVDLLGATAHVAIEPTRRGVVVARVARPQVAAGNWRVALRAPGARACRVGTPRSENRERERERERVGEKEDSSSRSRSTSARRRKRHSHQARSRSRSRSRTSGSHGVGARFPAAT